MRASTRSLDEGVRARGAREEDIHALQAGNRRGHAVEVEKQERRVERELSLAFAAAPPSPRTIIPLHHEDATFD